MIKKLDGKTALVTGGSRGIGAAIAERLAADGAHVAITYSASPDKANEVVAKIKAAGGKAVAFKADSGNVDQVKSVVAEAAKALGSIDILVNNAGIGTMGTIDTFSLDDFDRIVNVNVKGLFVATQEALKHMGKGGRVINIGSVMSDFSIFPGASVYTMTKSAVSGLTRGLARELGARGITINNVQPGPIDTDMNPADSEMAAVLAAGTALGHYGKAADIGSLVSYLASPEASFITGAGLLADGGVAA